MGLLSVVFTAPEAIATAPDLIVQGPQPPLPMYDCKGLDDVKIATLTALCFGVDIDDIDAVMKLCPEVIGEGESWVYPFPSTLADRLAALSPAERRDIGHRWARTEEWNIQTHEEHDFATFFDELCDFIAAHHTKPLWVWICL